MSEDGRRSGARERHEIIVSSIVGYGQGSFFTARCSCAWKSDPIQERPSVDHAIRDHKLMVLLDRAGIDVEVFGV